MTNQALIADLTKRTKWCLATCQAWKTLDEKILNQRESPDRWSALECLEHLNRYADFYLPEIAKVIQDAPSVATDHTFKSNWLGSKFSKMMLPIPEGGKTMNTFKNMNPLGSQLPICVLDTFLAHQTETLRLLPLCEKVNLSKLSTGITISNFIRLRLGDTLRVVIYHNQRHVEQAVRAMN